MSDTILEWEKISAPETSEEYKAILGMFDYYIFQSISEFNNPVYKVRATTNLNRNLPSELTTNIIVEEAKFDFTNLSFPTLEDAEEYWESFLIRFYQKALEDAEMVSSLPSDTVDYLDTISEQ